LTLRESRQFRAELADFRSLRSQQDASLTQSPAAGELEWADADLDNIVGLPAGREPSLPTGRFNIDDNDVIEPLRHVRLFLLDRQFGDAWMEWAPCLPELSAQSYNIILTTKSRARGMESLSENPDIPKKLDREVPLGA
jgi:hypothetical protein